MALAVGLRRASGRTEEKDFRASGEGILADGAVSRNPDPVQVPAVPECPFADTSAVFRDLDGNDGRVPLKRAYLDCTDTRGKNE